MDIRRLPSLRAVAAACAILAFPAAGAASTSLSPVPATASEAPPSPEAIVAARDLASRLTISGRFGEARRHWAPVAQLQRAAGELPIEAVRMQAELSHLAGRTAQAASLLKRLREDAMAAGNLEVSAEAFLDATLLYQRLRSSDEALLCMEQVERLLRAPSHDPQWRRALDRRVVQG